MYTTIKLTVIGFVFGTMSLAAVPASADLAPDPYCTWGDHYIDGKLVCMPPPPTESPEDAAGHACVRFAETSCKAVLVSKTSCHPLTQCHYSEDNNPQWSCRTETVCQENYKPTCKGKAPKDTVVYAAGPTSFYCKVKGAQTAYGL
jgi:hypothetical protein